MRAESGYAAARLCGSRRYGIWYTRGTRNGRNFIYAAYHYTLYCIYIKSKSIRFHLIVARLLDLDYAVFGLSARKSKGILHGFNFYDE